MRRTLPFQTVALAKCRRDGITLIVGGGYVRNGRLIATFTEMGPPRHKTDRRFPACFEWILLANQSCVVIWRYGAQDTSSEMRTPPPNKGGLIILLVKGSVRSTGMYRRLFVVRILRKSLGHVKMVSNSRKEFHQTKLSPCRFLNHPN